MRRLGWVLVLPLFLLLAHRAAAQSVVDLGGWQGNASFSGSNLDRAGTSISTGDFNGDGRWDVAIGTPGAEDNAGAVYIFFGTPSLLDSTRFTNLPAQADVVIHGTADLQLGGSVLLADVNQDGLEDLVAGAPHAQNDIGEVWIVFGSTTPQQDVTAPDVRRWGTVAAPASRRAAWTFRTRSRTC